jgi:hypothetical protein
MHVQKALIDGYQRSRDFERDMVSRPLDRLDLEVQRDQTEDESLEVLNKVVEDAKSFGVGGFGHVVDRSDLRSL